MSSTLRHLSFLQLPLLHTHMFSILGDPPQGFSSTCYILTKMVRGCLTHTHTHTHLLQRAPSTLGSNSGPCGHHGLLFLKPSHIIRPEVNRGPKGSRSVAFARVFDVPSVSYWGGLAVGWRRPVPSPMPGDAFDS